MALVVVPDGSDAEQLISARNRLRQYDFLEDSYRVWKDGHGFELNHRFICELNFYATQYLSDAPGQYRNTIQANVTVGQHIPPPWQEVEGHMNVFLEKLHRICRDGSPLECAAFALWRLNWIHPFVQGNGRTSRALSYFVLTQKIGWLPGKTIPERIRETRPEYCQLLTNADAALDNNGMTNLAPIVAYLNRLLTEQLAA